ncbi:MAG: hypothetical protein ACRCZZ_01805 [Phocaeicola sp.]
MTKLNLKLIAFLLVTTFVVLTSSCKKSDSDPIPASTKTLEYNSEVKLNLSEPSEASMTLKDVVVKLVLDMDSKKMTTSVRLKIDDVGFDHLIEVPGLGFTELGSKITVDHQEGISIQADGETYIVSDTKAVLEGDSLKLGHSILSGDGKFQCVVNVVGELKK